MSQRGPSLARPAEPAEPIIRIELAADLLVDQPAEDPVIRSVAAMVAVDDGTGVIRGDPDQPITVYSPPGSHYGFAAHGYDRGSMGIAMWNPAMQRYDLIYLHRKVFPGVVETGQQLSLWWRDATSYLVDSGIDVSITSKLAARYTWLRDGQFEVGDRVIAAFDQQFQYWYLLAGPWARADHTH